MAALNQANIVSVYDVAFEDHAPFIVWEMEGHEHVHRQRFWYSAVLIVEETTDVYNDLNGCTILRGRRRFLLRVNRGAVQKQVPLISVSDLAWVAYHYTFCLLCAILPRHLVYRLAEPLSQLRFRSLRYRAEDRLRSCCKVVIPPDQVSKTARLCISRLAESEIDNLLLMNP